MKIKAQQAKILPFNPSHQPGIDKLLHSIAAEYVEPFYSGNSRTIKELSLLPGYTYWVAMVSDEVIGTIGVLSNGNNTCVLKSMFLHSQFRSSGIANLLLNTVLEWSQQNKITDMYLGTMEQFKAAQRFYEKERFVKIEKEELPVNIVLNPVDTVFYKRTL